MATQSGHSGSSRFIGNAQSAEESRKEFIEVPMEASRQAAIGTALDLFAFMTALPDALLASDRRELKRLSSTAESKEDPRIERLKVSIARGEQLRENVIHGKARIDRMLVSVSEDGNVFHGFVSDSDLQPREKLTVRVIAETGDQLSTTTAVDGYFSITLGKGGRYASTKASPESVVNITDRMKELLMRVNAKSASNKSAASDDKAYTSGQVLARVEILDATGNILQHDVLPLVVNEGTAYREYVVDGNDAGTIYGGPKAHEAKPEAAKPEKVKAAEEKAGSAKATEAKPSAKERASAKATTRSGKTPPSNKKK